MRRSWQGPASHNTFRTHIGTHDADAGAGANQVLIAPAHFDFSLRPFHDRRPRSIQQRHPPSKVFVELLVRIQPEESLFRADRDKTTFRPSQGLLFGNKRFRTAGSWRGGTGTGTRRRSARTRKVQLGRTRRWAFVQTLNAFNDDQLQSAIWCTINRRFVVYERAA
jgi:hypothetical protein